MIRFDRRHYSDRAFSRPRAFKREGGRLRLILTPSRQTAAGDAYELDVLSGRERAVCEVLEERTGKWYLMECRPKVPPFVRQLLDRFVAELDAAGRQQEHAPPASTTTTAKKQTKKKTAKTVSPSERQVLAIAANAAPGSASFMDAGERRAVKSLTKRRLMTITSERPRRKGQSAELMAKLTAAGARALEQARAAPAAKTRQKKRATKPDARALFKEWADLHERMDAIGPLDTPAKRRRMAALAAKVDGVLDRVATLDGQGQAAFADSRYAWSNRRAEAVVARDRARAAPAAKKRRAIIEDKGGQLAMFGQTEMFPS